MDKLLLAWALLAIGIQGRRLQDQEKSKLDVTESAATGTPVKALAALLLASNLDRSAALVVGPHAPHAGLSHGQVGQGKSLNRKTNMMEGGSRVRVLWSVAGPSGPGTVVSIGASQSDSRFPVAVRFDRTGETYNFAVDDLIEVGDEPEGLVTRLAKNAEKMLLNQLAKKADKEEAEEAEKAKNRKLAPGMDELDDRAFRSGPGPTMTADYQPGDPRLETRSTSSAPIFVVMWYCPIQFVYETPYGGAEMSPEGRSVVRLSTLAQALAFGKRLQKSAPVGNIKLSYSVYKMENAEMQLKGTYPKSVNVKDARIRFRKRQPKLGGADDGTLLGVGGMGDDIWRELTTKDSMDSVDEAWSEFRKKLELGRELEVVDENGDRVQFGDYPDEEDPEID